MTNDEKGGSGLKGEADKGWYTITKSAFLRTEQAWTRLPQVLQIYLNQTEMKKVTILTHRYRHLSNLKKMTKQNGNLKGNKS